jgi:PAS domain S-box-containing protein
LITEQAAEQSVSNLRPGDHLCSIYEDENQHRELVTRFLADGLSLGQKVIFVCADQQPEEVLSWLRAAGKPADAAVASGQLEILRADETYTPGGRFDPDAMLDLVSRRSRQATAEGYPALRGAGEMSWAKPSVPGTERLFEYEARMAGVCRDFPALILCLYNRRSFDPTFLLDVLLIHPRVVVGIQIFDNFYYIPPEALLNKDRASARLDQWLDNLSSRQQMQKQLEQTLHHLESLISEASADLVQANAALRESERRYKTIFDYAGDAIFINDLEGHILEVNQIGCQRLGFSREELIGLTPHRIVTADQVEQVSTRLARLRERGYASFETTHLTRDGRTVPVEINARRITYEGSPAVLNVARDITERKIAEKAIDNAYTALRESETKFRSLVEKSPVGIVLTDESGMVIEWNETAQNIYGIPPEKVLGRPIWDVRLDSYPRHLRTPEFSTRLENSIRDFLQTGQADFLYRPEERELIRPDGQVRYIQRIRFPIRTRKGFLLATTVVDVTDHTLAEREVERYRQKLEAMVSERTLELQYRSVELRESEERYRALVNQSPLTIMVVQDGRFVFVNPAAAKKLGYENAAELIGHEATEVAASESLELIRARIAQVELGKSNPPMVIQFQTPAGEIVFSESASSPIFYEGHQATLVVGQDVTDRIRYEQQLEASLAEKEVMLREIHHRVKNNLNIIIALIDLQKATQTDPQVLQVFKELQMRAQTMSLVHESLYHSPSLAEVDFAGYLHTLIAYLYSAYGPTGQGEQQTIDLRIEAENIPLRIETAIPCGLIVNELLTNALKYAFPPAFQEDTRRKPVVTVRLEKHCAEKDCEYLALSVADNGVGLPPDLDWRTAQTLGLQLIQVLSRQLGADLRLDTREGVTWCLQFKERG